ncbi:MAG: Gfo/Idh/MocA family oxidoreductase [Verrucomicrobiota bacterium]
MKPAIPTTPTTPTTRRKFLQTAGGFGAALAFPHSKVLGANDAVRVGVVGVNGRGKSHLDAFAKMDGARVSAICDIDPKPLDLQTVKLSEQQGFKVKGFVDMREMIDGDHIDVFTTATPNHWHSLAGIWAIQAGKDAYVEKPISHNVWEGRQLVNAARKYNQICQGGTQSRSLHSVQEAVQYVHDGKLGKIEFVKGLCYKPRQSIGLGGNGEIPEGVDYDLWSGPAEIEEPLRRKRFHYDWHWFYEYGNGDMGNQGIHQMDVARWFLDEPKLSPYVISIGERLGYQDDAETPNTQIVYHAYDKAPLIFETRGLPVDKAAQEDGWGKKMNSPEEFPGDKGTAVVVQCEEGRVFCDSGGSVKITDNDGNEIHQVTDEKDRGAIFENFMEAVRSRKTDNLLADCEETHISSALCHTGLISHRLGDPMHGGEVLERIQDDKLLTARFEAMADHLDKNEVDLDSETIVLGAALKFNPDTEWFEDNGDLDEKANALATRVYREPYVVPKEV